MKKILTKMIIITLISYIVISFGYYLSVIFGNFTPFAITEYFVKNEAGILSPFSILADLAVAIAIGFMYFIIPEFIHFVAFISYCIARLFQIGEYKSWKDKVSNVFIIIAKVSLIILIVYTSFLLIISEFNIFLILAIAGIIYEMVLLNKEDKNIENITKETNN